MKGNIKIRYPVYYNEFKCIGGACEDNCCNGWEINIDKSTFKQYEKIQNEKMKKYIKENIFIKENCKNVEIDYAQIKLNNNDKCPFLGKDNNCIIQTKLGEEYLSDVCSSFPRIINKIDDYYEVSLDVSCIEAARILLLKKEGIDFEENESSLGKHALTIDINSKAQEFKYTNYTYIKEIRNKSIQIIKNRKFKLSERLYMLGCFLESMHKELCYNFNNVNEFINEYEVNSFGEKLKINSSNRMLQVSFYKEILEMMDIFECSNYFQNIINKIIIGFRFNKNESLMENSELYLEAYNICEREIFQKYDYIFENYLVNYMFKDIFPFSESDMIINDYIMMLVRFSYIRFFIVGEYLYDHQISKEKIIRVIQSLSKEIEHNKKYMKGILKYIKEYQLDNKRFIGILLQ